MLHSPFDWSNSNLDAIISDTFDSVSWWNFNVHIFLIQQKTCHSFKMFWQSSSIDVTRNDSRLDQEVIPDQDESCQYQLFYIRGRDVSYPFDALYTLLKPTALLFLVFLCSEWNKMLVYKCSCLMCSILGRKTYTVLPPRARIKKSTDPRQIVRSAILCNRGAQIHYCQIFFSIVSLLYY